jgi:hypothetical protein
MGRIARKFKIRNGLIYYKCCACKGWKKETEFYPNNQVANKRSSNCKICSAKLYKAYVKINGYPPKKREYKYKVEYDPNRPTQREINPKEWYEYLKNKLNQYKKDPVFKIKTLLSTAIITLIRKKELVKPENCQKCKVTAPKIRAYFTDKLAKKIMKEKTGRYWNLTPETLNQIQWLCPKCCLKNRKTNK